MLLSVLLLAGSMPGDPPKYHRYKLFELALCAEVVVSGEIEHVNPTAFGLRIDGRFVADDVPDLMKVQRFVNWTCASRWTDYRAGQRVLLFLDWPTATSSEFRILGAGGEGEMPLSGFDVIVRGYEVHGHEGGSHRVDGVDVQGSRIDLDELVAAVRGFRAAFEWTKDSGTERVASIRPRDAERARAFGESSRAAHHLLEEARSSPAWSDSGDEEGELFLHERFRKISARDLACTGPLRLDGRLPDRFGFELWSGFGRALAFPGDVDGDGVVDLAVGAPSDSRAGHFAGAFWMLLLERDGTVKTRIEIGEGAGGFPAVLNEFAALGEALAPLGDLNGDGVPDLAVGADGWSGPAKKRGGVWILLLRRDGSVGEAVELGSAKPMSRDGVGEGSGIGSALASLGDLDGDGSPELAIGQDPEFQSSRRGYAVRIVSLAPNGSVRWVRRLHDREDGFVRRSSWFGSHALARVGDLDGDGTPELAIGDGYDADGGALRGAVWIVFLWPDGALRGRQKISDWAGGFGGLLRDGAGFGGELAGPGDLDGDGVEDLLVGSAAGLWTLFLNRDGSVRAQRLLRSPNTAPDPEAAFPVALACSSVPGPAAPFLAVSGVLRGGAAPTQDRDALVWFFALEDDARLAPW